MGITRPTGEQLRFRSVYTGDHVLDTYLESAEKGGRSIPDLLDDLFDASGVFRDGNFEFRFDPTTDKLQFRIGNFANSTSGWTDLTSFFDIKGAFNAATTYKNFDVVTLTDKDVYIVHGLTTNTTFANEAAFEASANTTKLIDVSEAREWASQTTGLVRSTDYSAKAWSIGGTGVTNGDGAAKEWAIKTTGTVDGTNYSAKYWATHPDVVTVSTNIADVNTVAADITNVNTVASDISNVNTTATNISDVNTVAAEIGVGQDVTTVAADLNGTDTIGTVATDISNVNITAGSIANVNTVAGSITNVNTVSANIADVNTVTPYVGAGNDITVVAAQINNNNLQTIAADINAVITTANDLNEAVSEIDTVANSITNVDTVGTNIADVNTTAASITSVNTNATNIADINTVAAAILNVNTTATDIANVNTNATNIADINTNATNIGSINTVATDIANVNTTATNILDVNTVAADITKVNTVSLWIANVNTNATNIVDINTVASDITNVNTTATNIADVNTVATNIASVNTTATDILNVNTTATNIADVNTVATNIANVNTVSGINADVTTVATNNTNVTTVSTNIADVNTVAGISGNVTTVAGIAANVTTVATNDANVTTVAGINTDVTTVAGIASDVTTVSTNNTDVTTVANNVADVNTVAAVSTDVTTVATDIANVNTAAANIADINTVASIASDVTTAAANSVAFNNTYLGASATAPTLDPDGSALDLGDLYFDTATSTMKVYGSAGWVPAGSSVNGTAARFSYTATLGQTNFSGADSNNNSLAYDAGFLDVYMNGIKLVNGADFTATDGATVQLGSGAAVNDTIEIIAYGTFTLSNQSINDMTDVSTASVADGDLLVYNAANSQFEVGNTDIITTAMIQDDAITTAKLADDSVTSAKIGTDVAATQINYSNTVSGISALTVQEAIDYLNTLSGGSSGYVASYTRDNFTATSGQTTFTTSNGYTLGYLQVFANGVLLDVSDYTANDASTVVLATAADAGEEIVIIALDSFAIAEILRVTSISASAPDDSLTLNSSGQLKVPNDIATVNLYVTSGGDTAANGISGGIKHGGINSKSVVIEADPANVGANTQLYFNVDGSTKFSMNSSGNLVVTSGGGIQFASGDALDDYEVGTWTPVWKGITTAGTSSWSNYVSKYVKVGNLVTCFVGGSGISLSGASGQLALTGLPFTIGTTTGVTPSGGSAPLSRNFTWTGQYYTTHCREGTDRVEFWGISNGGGYTPVPVSGCGTEMYLTFTYYTD